MDNRDYLNRDYLSLGKRAAILSLRRIAAKHPNGWLNITKEDLKDLTQEAAIKIALLAKKKPEAYPGLLIKVGKQACFNWIFRKRSLKIPVENIINIDTNRDPDSSDFILENEDKIKNFLINARSKKGQRGINAVAKEVQILSFLARGWSETEIALELGLSRDEIHQTRRKLRKRLEGFLPTN